MTEFSVEALSRSDDKFAFILECAELYPGSRRQRVLSAIAGAQAEGFLSRDPDIEIGLLLLRRLGAEATTDELLASLDSIHDSSQYDEKRRFVRSCIRLTRERQYAVAASELRALLHSLRHDDQNMLYGQVAQRLGIACGFLGEHAKAEGAFQEALGTFQRYEYSVSHAFALNDYAVLRKKMGHYLEALRLQEMAGREFESSKVEWGTFLSVLNLGILNLRLGDWQSSVRRSVAAFAGRARLLGELDRAGAVGNFVAHYPCEANLAHARIIGRQFADAEGLLVESLELINKTNADWPRALAHEFLGELYTETRQFKKAKENLDRAYHITSEILPGSDVMTEVLRRQAELHYRLKEYDEAGAKAHRCIRLSKQISDQYELGAALRVLGQVHAACGYPTKASNAFDAAIRTLKSIHECYELLRAQLALGELQVNADHRDAEITLLEARQNARKLDLDFYLAQIEILLALSAARKEEWEASRAHLAQAESLTQSLQECDRKHVQPGLEAATREIDERILRISIKGAEEVKVICKIYEEARFPMEDMKADLAYRVAQSVGADSLFLALRVRRGYGIPIAYNVPRKEARETVRRLDRDRDVPLLGVDGEPKAMTAYTGKLMLCIPGKRHVLCTQFATHDPLNPRQFEHLLASVEALERLAEEQEEGPRKIDSELVGNAGLAHPRGSFKDILTVDPEMIKLIHLAERAADGEAPILIQGETGVGKELFARAVHGASPRGQGPFVAINAGAMPPALLESQLFGHVKGAFTDAVRDRTGLLEEARSGTVFFDEIGEMGDELQVKLLRLLESGEYRRLGDNGVRTTDVRVISATNRNLSKEVDRGLFRRDLFYRLGAVKLEIPALRFRKNDIPLLARHFLRDCAIKNRKADRTFQVDVKAVEALELYDWPGNVRELHNEFFRVVSLIGGGETVRFGMLSDAIKDYLKDKNRSEGLLEKSVERYERALILTALEKHDWNRLRTAEAIGLPRTTLITRMKKLNISPRDSA